MNVKTPGCKTSILIESDKATRTLGIDKFSESPTGDPQTITLVNIAANNSYVNVEQ